MKIKFNRPYFNPKFEFDFQHLSGDGVYTKQVSNWFQKKINCKRIMLTTSCTDALELSAILLDVCSGDEIISPSYTFVSTVNAFVLRGAKIVFVDIEPSTMNIDAELIESAITAKTKAIVVVHYAGISCNMNKIIDIAKRHNLAVVEDAAQGVMAKFNDQYLGTIGDLGTYSFHETKNYTMGEGGALVINDSKYIERAEIIREKGTNRSRFLRGQVDKYTWVDIGSSYLPSDILAAYLYPQLEHEQEIFQDRHSIWDYYLKELSDMTQHIELPFVPNYATHNAHMFYVKTKEIEERTALINHLAMDGIQAVFHYVPLHSSPAGKKYGRFHGIDRFTTLESERLLRLPIYYQMDKNDVLYVCNSIKRFYSLTNR